MKTRNYLLSGLSILIVSLLSSCVDNAYDLSDIDTTARFKTNSLVVPLQLDHVTLDQVLDLSDGSDVVQCQDENGELIYAMERIGSFASEGVEVSQFNMEIQETDETQASLNLQNQIDMMGEDTDGMVACYEITEENSTSASFESVESAFAQAIMDIEKIGVNTEYTDIIHVDGLNQSIFKNTFLTGLEILYPKGMSARPEKGNYDPETGILDLKKERLQLNKNGEVEIRMKVDSITCDENFSADYRRHVAKYKGTIKILSGKVGVYTDAKLPANVRLSIKNHLDDIKVNAFTGKLGYTLEDLTIDPIHIDNLPDLLSQTNTKLNLENPQIYLSLTNPLHNYDLKFKTDMAISAKRDNESKTYRPDNGSFETQTAKATDNEFVLSPKLPDFYFTDYEAPQHVAFSGLKSILGELDGIPSLIEMDAIDPSLTGQHVTDFQLGTDYGSVEGEYAFFAPLQLTENSQVVYIETIDGWNSEDLDAITIDSLSIAFDATTETPFEIELTVRPVDTSGKPIAGVNITKAIVPALAKDVPTVVTMTGTITHLDGILIEARLVNKRAGYTLGPSMTLYMKNSKFTVNGAYEKEL